VDCENQTQNTAIDSIWILIYMNKKLKMSYQDEIDFKSLLIKVRVLYWKVLFHQKTESLFFFI